MTTSRDFTGKVVLITGSSGGIGAVTAVEFARLGAQVVVTGRGKDRVSAVAKRCTEASPTGAKALEVVADVTNDDDCHRLVTDTIKTFKKLDILVNNAGRSIKSSIWDEDVLDKYELNMNTNLRSVVWLTHLCVEHLEKTKGNIVNVSSVASFKPGASISCYSMSKCAINTFTKCMAVELAPKKIRVNAVCKLIPATIHTPAFEAIFNVTGDRLEAFKQRLAVKYPIGRIGEPSDVANAVVHLASEHATFITGAYMLVDGGYLTGSVKMRT
ncbi:unnamed protein product [Oppiella nova]|uniref:Ketoreductase domain-containing protein n=1 Tax=Oppiella nova TaxID=334625 RepID=A0A7R9QPY3_9ACAR|nr:unnamed protein product [Oppiella nova]CAG2171320.1 unnamed protein product [Oppiella nova]